MTLDFSCYATPISPPDFSMFGSPVADSQSAEPWHDRPMLRNAKVLADISPKSEQAEAGQELPTETTGEKPVGDIHGPLFIAGDPKAVLPLLEQHGIVLAIRTPGGVKVGRTQARQARELIDTGATALLAQ
jgi:hypothetical protein